MDKHFRLATIKGYIGTMGYKHLLTPLKVRFHSWAEKVVVKEGRCFSETYAIVEDENTGVVYDVNPKSITFIN